MHQRSRYNHPNYGHIKKDSHNVKLNSLKKNKLHGTERLQKNKMRSLNSFLT